MKIKVLVEFETDGTEPTDTEIKEYVENAIGGECYGYGEASPFFGMYKKDESIKVHEVHMCKDAFPSIWVIVKDTTVTPLNPATFSTGTE